MSSLNILHLSDFHIGNFRYDDPRTLSVKIVHTLSDAAKKVDVIVVSGDIFDGRRGNTKYEEDRKKAILLFETLISQLIANELVVNTFSKEDILFVPGNHDLVRDKSREYEKYDAFIDEFFLGGRKSANVVFSDKYSFYYVFPEKKVAILGFNSCKIETETVKAEELKWVDKIDLSSFPEPDKIKAKIKEERNKEKKWDDFGYIDTIEMTNLFLRVKKAIPNLSEYTIVATFHHHFYPFPEIVNKYGDPSWIRNYQEVVDNFFRNDVSIVLHGHKHLSIHRAVTDNKYFENPDAVIYVLAAGSAGCKEVYTPSFQWLRVFERQAAKIAEVERYDFKDEELGSTTNFTLPPQKKEEKSVSIQLLETLQTEDPELYKKYINLTDDFEQVFQDNNINKIIEVISGLITIFKDIKLELQKDPQLIYALLICINYRVIYLRNIRTKETKENLNVLLSNLETAINELYSEESYAQNLLNFLKSTTNKELDDTYYEKIIKNVKVSEKRNSAYLSIGVFFTDLFLNISQYGEYYFEKEGIIHKINIKLDKDVFYNNIPNQTISIEGNIDRRAIILNFKCKNPTVHKIAVLIVKDFEMRLTKFEDSLKEINLKLYYILPKVQPDKYDLENFHFDAYIPTLLPLLTGDNLYKQKEVFIRELVQNSIDAVLLRQKLQPDEAFDKTIRIELGTERRGQKQVKYFKIIDEGIGMTNFTIERYFTSIGRSFYVSEEFDELQKNKNIKYQAISNFGIGFLSSFMVCEEVAVKTKSILDSGAGLEIEIPNYEGCFFIKNHAKDNIGTEITLYEDKRSLFNFEKFIIYAQKVFLNIPLNLEIIDKDSIDSKIIIENHSLQKHLILKQLRADKKPIFFIPFNDKGVGELSWHDLNSKNIDDLSKFGVYFDFSDFKPKNQRSNYAFNKTLNQGLAISENYNFLKINQEFYPVQYANFSSAFIQLDVSREKIIQLKEGFKLKQDVIIENLKKQIEGYVQDNSFTNNIFPIEIEKVINFLELGFMNNNSGLIKFTYSMKIELYKDEYFQLSLIQNCLIPKDYDASKIGFYNVNFDLKNYMEGKAILLKNKILKKSSKLTEGGQKEIDKLINSKLIKEIYSRLEFISRIHIEQWDYLEHMKKSNMSMNPLEEIERIEKVDELERLEEMKYMRPITVQRGIVMRSLMTFGENIEKIQINKDLGIRDYLMKSKRKNMKEVLEEVLLNNRYSDNIIEQNINDLYFLLSQHYFNSSAKISNKYIASFNDSIFEIFYMLLLSSIKVKDTESIKIKLYL